MNLVVLENKQVVGYNVTYDNGKMRDFLKEIVDDYGFFRDIQLKTTNTKDILLQCNEFRNLQVLKTYEDNSRIHKGRKRIPRKVPLRKHLYSMTLVDYPEIYYTICNFLKQSNMDFTVFLKYIEADININYKDVNYYIEEGYMDYKKDAVKDLKTLLLDDMNAKMHIENVINKRLLQRECLKEFYDLLSFDYIGYSPILDDTTLFLYNLLYSNMSATMGLMNREEFMGITEKFINGDKKLMLSLARNVKNAKINSDIIAKISDQHYVKTKTK